MTAMTAIAGRTTITRAQVMKWHEGWNDSDRATIARAIDLCEDPHFYVLTGDPRKYVGVTEGPSTYKAVFAIYPGFIWFNHKALPEAKPDAEARWPGSGVTLSTHVYQSHHRPAPEQFGICPVHHMALPATGVCDDCS